MSNNEKDVDRVEDVDYLGEDNDLSLVYVKVHRCVLEAFVAHNLSKTAMKVYLYLCFNAIVYKGVSFRTPYKDIADYLSLSVRSIYHAVSDLQDAGLILIRHHGDLVCDIPALLLANAEARQRGQINRQKADDAVFQEEVDKHEFVLGRSLSSNERRRLRQRFEEERARETQ